LLGEAAVVDAERLSITLGETKLNHCPMAAMTSVDVETREVEEAKRGQAGAGRIK